MSRARGVFASGVVGSWLNCSLVLSRVLLLLKIDCCCAVQVCASASLPSLPSSSELSVQSAGVIGGSCCRMVDLSLGDGGAQYTGEDCAALFALMAVFNCLLGGARCASLLAAHRIMLLFLPRAVVVVMVSRAVPDAGLRLSSACAAIEKKGNGVAVLEMAGSALHAAGNLVVGWMLAYRRWRR